MSLAEPRKRERILVVRADRVGDIILTIPVFWNLRENFPKSTIAALVAPHGREILRLEESVDEFIVYERAGKHSGLRGLLLLTRELRKNKFDCVLFIQPEGKLALASYLARIQERIGTLYRPYSLLFTKKHAQHKSPSLKHEMEYSLDILRELGMTPRSGAPAIRLSDEEIENANSLKREIGLEESSKPIVVHPGSSGSSGRWPVSRFRELVDLIISDGKEVVVSGNCEELPLLEEMIEPMKEKPLSIVGRTDLRTLAAFYSLSKLVVSNSTGVVHLSAAVGTPTAAVFSPVISSSPTRWRPIGKRHKVFLPDVPECKKCTEEKCVYFDCMEKVLAQDVFRDIRDMIA
ncbi:MAG: glycosyltransferase family 9 protein [Candidatus Eisenbacteria bacterium]|nr:glycosyltransferase family 9 protein [Candidatus Eisenbacteria bacterium]